MARYGFPVTLYPVVFEFSAFPEMCQAVSLTTNYGRRHKREIFQVH